MPAFQAVFLISTLAVFAFAWLKGGHVERMGVVVMLVGSVASVLLTDIGQGRHRLGVIAVDAAVMVILAHLALTRDRWWLLVATAGQLLAMLAHASLFLDPELSLRDNVAVRWVFGMVVLYSLLGGVLERRLAGEAAVSRAWARRSRPDTG